MLGGVERGRGPPSREGVAPPRPTQDWDKVDVGKLISDLDEDIRNSEMENSPPRQQGGMRPSLSGPHPPRPPTSMPPRPPPTFSQEENDKGLKMKIKRTKSGRQEIVKAEGGVLTSPTFNGNFDNESGGRYGGANPGGGSHPPQQGGVRPPGLASQSSQGGGRTGGGTPTSQPAVGGARPGGHTGPSPPQGGGRPGGPPPSPSGGPPPPSGGPPPHQFPANGPSPAVSRPNSISGPHMMMGPNSIGVGSGPPSSGPSLSSGSGPGSSAGSGSSGESGPSSSSGESGPPSPQIKSENTAVSELNGTCYVRPAPSAVNTSTLKVEVGTVTDASTVTEPEILGPCEPGTAVNLDGIVWHETDTGVLVVNITWRGRTYVGTLLDCARHTNQWSAPRFTDSPEPGGKGRGKRGRTTNTPSEPEPRKNLRSSKGKGKGGKGGKNHSGQQQSVQEEEFNFPAPASPAKDAAAKRKKETDLEESKKRKRTSSDSDDSSSSPQDDIKPTPPPKREPKPLVYSYTMLECPRKDCNKQYKHDDGLKWHVSHAHPEFIGPDGEIRDSSEVEREEQERKKKARSKEEKEERKKKESKPESGGTPAKQLKLDESKNPAQISTPVAESKLKSGLSSAAQPPRPGNLQVGPGLYTPPSVNGRVSHDDLKHKVKMPGESPSASTAPPNPPPLLAVSPSLEREKPAAGSPAYSDISDDGEDSRGKDIKLPQGISIPSSHVSIPTSFSSAPNLVRSSPMPRTESTTITTTPTTPKLSSFILPGSGAGPQLGTPEYHKYLAANGFPPFPYPYPVGMDPNYHVQLLKTDLVYKGKWEKDRADRERAFKEQLDKDQGKFSGLSLVKEDRLQVAQPRKSDGGKPEDLRKREPSGDSRPRSRTSPMINMISVKPEFREKEEVKREIKIEEGVKPTMETRGPPPGPQTYGYIHPSLIRPPYSMGVLPPPFDPMFVSAGGANLSPYGFPPGVQNPYLSPAMLGSGRPPFSFGDPMLRAPFPSLPLGADDLARVAAGGNPGLSGTKALDLLQQHASQYYANQKLAELQERALKSPISSLASGVSLGMGMSQSLSKPITTLAGKDSPTPTSASSKSPPPLRHVHTHTHTHIGLGYPLLAQGLTQGALPAVPTGLPPGALPPPPVGVGSVPYSSSSAYPGKSPS